MHKPPLEENMSFPFDLSRVEHVLRKARPDDGLVSDMGVMLESIHELLIHESRDAERWHYKLTMNILFGEFATSRDLN